MVGAPSNNGELVRTLKRGRVVVQGLEQTAGDRLNRKSCGERQNQCRELESFLHGSRSLCSVFASLARTLNAGMARWGGRTARLGVCLKDACHDVTAMVRRVRPGLLNGHP